MNPKIYLALVMLAPVIIPGSGLSVPIPGRTFRIENDSRNFLCQRRGMIVYV